MSKNPVLNDCSTAQGKAHAATCEAGARDAARGMIGKRGGVVGVE